MGYTIAIAGKGGTGKTTVSALLVRLLKEKGEGSVLAVDADPNSNLAEVLGVEVSHTIGSILDDIAAHPDKIPSGISKDSFIEYQVRLAVQESQGFDVLTMGRPEGPGCYCYVNNVLRNVMAGLLKDYRYVVIDNEAGLEHLSRRTTRQADALVVISDATVIGLRAARRINDIVKELKIKVKNKFLLINREISHVDKDKIDDVGLEYIGAIPADNQIEKLSLEGDSLMDLRDDAISLSSLRKLGEKIWQSN